MCSTLSKVGITTNFQLQVYLVGSIDGMVMDAVYQVFLIQIVYCKLENDG